MNRLLVTAVVVMVSGCKGGLRQECFPDQSCSPGLECVQGVCLDQVLAPVPAPVDAGSACPAACADWQSCSVRDRACVDAVIQIVSPRPSELFAPGALVRVEAFVSTKDGEPVALAEIPVGGSLGLVLPPSLKRGPGGSFIGDVRLPSTIGPVSVRVGWSANSSTVEVVTQGCSETCAAWQVCVPSGSGGRCRDLRMGLRWSSPAEGQLLRPNAVVTAAVEVIGDEAPAFDAPIPVIDVGRGVLGELRRSGLVWAAELGTDSSDATHTLLAGWPDGGPTATVTYSVDATPPSVSLVFASDAGVYQRDALVPVVMTANEEIADASVRLAGVEMAARPSWFCPHFSSTPEARQCFMLDFSQPELLSLQGRWMLTASASDDRGNVAIAPDAGVVGVTRTRWLTAPMGVSYLTASAFAIAPDGTLYVGTADNLFTYEGYVLKVDPGTGGLLSSSSRGSVLSLSASGSYVFFAANSTGAGSIGYFSTDPVFPVSGGLGGPVDVMTWSGIALAFRRPGIPAAVGSFNSTSTSTGGTVEITAGSSGFFFQEGAIAQARMPNGVPGAAVNVIAARVATGMPIISYLVAPQFDFVPVWQPVMGIEQSRSDAGAPVRLDQGGVPTGQALLPDGGFLIAIDGVSQNIFVGRWSGGAVPAAIGGKLDGGSWATAPVVVNGREAYAGVGRTLQRFDPLTLSTTAVLVNNDGGRDYFAMSPVLGKGRDGGPGQGYAQSVGGQLTVFSLEPDGGVLWSESIGRGVSARAHPTLDCNRQNPSSRTGVLYLDYGGGRIMALIVDSPGLLDTPGAWPKYQRSAGNAGNDDLVNFPTNWPGCP